MATQAPTQPASIDVEILDTLAGQSLVLVVNYGATLLDEGMLQEADFVFDYVLRKDAKSIYGWYNRACVRARQGNAQRAMASLEKAVEYGYGDFEHMRRDPDLAPLRSDPRFVALAVKSDTPAQEKSQPR